MKPTRGGGGSGAALGFLRRRRRGGGGGEGGARFTIGSTLGGHLRAAAAAEVRPLHSNHFPPHPTGIHPPSRHSASLTLVAMNVVVSKVNLHTARASRAPVARHATHPPTAVHIIIHYVSTTATTTIPPSPSSTNPPVQFVSSIRARCSLSRCSRRSNALCHAVPCTPLIVLIFRTRCRCKRCSFTVCRCVICHGITRAHSFQDPNIPSNIYHLP